MKLSKKIEPLENSSVKLTITVPKSELSEEYSAIVAKYIKTAQIPGFRKGKAPQSILEQKFGDALRGETISTVLEKAVEETFEDIEKNDSDNRPLPYSQPALDSEPASKIDTDLEFSLVYDIMPKVTVSGIDAVSIKVPQATVGDTELQEELKAIQERNAMVIDKKDDVVIEKDNIVTIDYVELDKDKKEIADTKRSDFVFTVGAEEGMYKFDADVLGLKKNDNKVVTKKRDESEKDTESKEATFNITIKAVKERNLPALDDELAQDVNEKYKTLDDMKADIKRNLELALKNKLQEVKVAALLEQLVEKNSIILPLSMIRAETESRWRMMARQFQTTTEQLEKLMATTGKTKNDLLDEWKDDATKRLKSSLIVESLIKERKITVEEPEVESKIEEIAKESDVSIDEIKKHYADSTKKEYLIEDIKEQKLYDQLFTEIKITKGEKTTFADLFKK